MVRRDAVVAALGAAALVAFANRSGVGWSWDSTDYVETGTNLAEGRGLLDVTGRLMTVRPPGLPFVLAVGHAIGANPGATIQVLNVACAATVVVLGGLLLSHAGVGTWPRRWALAMLAASPALLWQWTMAWSEPPFLALELAMLAVALHARRAWRWPVLAALGAALFFVRYVGPVFAVAILAAGTVAHAARRGWARSVALHATTLCVGALPVWWWLARNHRIDGTWTGTRVPGGGSLLGPLHTATATLGTWVLGRPFEGGIYMTWADYPASARAAGAAAATLLVAGLAYGGVRTARTRRPEPLGIACASVVVAYVAFSAWRFVYAELGPLDNRMMIPLFPPLVLLAALGVDRVVRRGRGADRAARRGRVAGRGVAVACGALLVAQVATGVRDASVFGRDGRHWGSRAFQRAPIHETARGLPGPAGWYSNEPQQLYAVVRRGPILTQYQKDDGPRQRCTHRYVLWYARTFLPDDEPEALPVVFTDDWGTIYDLGPCDENVNLRWP